MSLVINILPSDYENIEGWCSVEKANKIIELVKTSNPGLIVELGVFGGRSLLAFGLGCKTNNLKTVVIGIDAWSTDASLEGKNDVSNDEWWSKIDYKSMENYTQNIMKKYDVNDIVKLWKEKSVDVANRFKINSIDILHQDSNHSEEVSMKEVEVYADKIKSGGFWVFDDANWETTKKAQNLLISKGFYEVYSEPSNSWKIFRKN